MGARIAMWILKYYGWNITGHYPYELPRLIMIAAPHTSNWDFPLGMLVRTALKIKANFIAKHTLFVWPLGYLMRAVGGIPVNRNSRANFVNKTIEAVESADHAHLIISPEGHRKKVEKFKTGFYHIAKGVQMPIIPVVLNWETRNFHFGEAFYTTDNQEADLEYLWNYFKGIPGHTPSNGIF